MAIELPNLPYPKDSLAPHLSPETLDFHYGKHHKSYVDKLNLLISGTELEKADLLTIIRKSEGGIFNNAAQVWNHTFYWNCLKPKGGGEPSGQLKEKIDQQFGNFRNFKNQFTEAAINNFGSGWSWLVRNPDGSLSIESTSNAETPAKDINKTALMTCDVWEHAYYIDYRNARAKYLESFWQIVNWDFVESQLRSKK